jgi:pimeloyl-ACP methyl ester carboxylesterase
VPLLEAAGRVALTPTLTGCGDRAAELSPAVTLERHVDDVIAGLVGSDLRDVVLVGHSYSGMVITGVAERAADRLAALVFVDAFYPGHAESALDQMPATFQALFRQRAEDEGEGWRLPANDGLLDVWGLHEAGLRAWVRPRLTDWSLNCFTSAVDAPAMHRTEIRRSYLSANAAQYPAKAVFAPIADKAQADGCRIHRFDTGHDIMIEDPRKFADALLTTTV